MDSSSDWFMSVLGRLPKIDFYGGFFSVQKWTLSQHVEGASEKS